MLKRSRFDVAPPGDGVPERKLRVVSTVHGGAAPASPTHGATNRASSQTPALGLRASTEPGTVLDFSVAAGAAAAQARGMSITQDAPATESPLAQQQQQQTSAAMAHYVGGPQQQQQRTTLWIGDLERWEDELHLYTILIQILPPSCEIVSVTVVRDNATGYHMGYGFVNFATADAAVQALEICRDAARPGHRRKFKVNWAASNTHRSVASKDAASLDAAVTCQVPTNKTPPDNTRKCVAVVPGAQEEILTIFIGSLDRGVDETQLGYMLASLGFEDDSIASLKVARMETPTGASVSRGFAFVRFRSCADRDAALLKLQGLPVNGAPLHVSIARRDQGAPSMAAASHEASSRSVRDLRSNGGGGLIGTRVEVPGALWRSYQTGSSDTGTFVGAAAGCDARQLARCLIDQSGRTGSAVSGGAVDYMQFDAPRGWNPHNLWAPVPLATVKGDPSFSAAHPGDLPHACNNDISGGDSLQPRRTGEAGVVTSSLGGEDAVNVDDNVESAQPLLSAFGYSSSLLLNRLAAESTTSASLGGYASSEGHHMTAGLSISSSGRAVPSCQLGTDQSSPNSKDQHDTWGFNEDPTSGSFAVLTRPPAALPSKAFSVHCRYHHGDVDSTAVTATCSAPQMQLSARGSLSAAVAPAYQFTLLGLDAARNESCTAAMPLEFQCVERMACERRAKRKAQGAVGSNTDRYKSGDILQQQQQHLAAREATDLRELYDACHGDCFASLMLKDDIASIPGASLWPIASSCRASRQKHTSVARGGLGEVVSNARTAAPCDSEAREPSASDDSVLPLSDGERGPETPLVLETSRGRNSSTEMATYCETESLYVGDTTLLDVAQPPVVGCTWDLLFMTRNTCGFPVGIEALLAAATGPAPPAM